jgi:excisionase family DNA binding protein
MEPGEIQHGSSLLLTYQQVAEKYGVCVRTVRNWVVDCGLPVIKIGRKVWVSSQDLAAFLERHKTSGQGA